MLLSSHKLTCVNISIEVFEFALTLNDSLIKLTPVKFLIIEELHFSEPMLFASLPLSLVPGCFFD